MLLFLSLTDRLALAIAVTAAAIPAARYVTTIGATRTIAANRLARRFSQTSLW